MAITKELVGLGALFGNKITLESGGNDSTCLIWFFGPAVPEDLVNDLGATPGDRKGHALRLL